MTGAEGFAARQREREEAEVALLARLRERKAGLAELLARCSDHWGFEDPVYRFYHQSFKVFQLQETTKRIVAALGDLAPERPMHEWFVEILALGTGHEFTLEHNSRWTEVTRPILEAFFHARFFLEMAVRYSTLDAPTDPDLAQGVEGLLSEMKLEQQIVALREKRGLTPRQLARLLGTSQPYVAKLESGRVTNLGVKTLVKCARALGASVSIKMEPIRGKITPLAPRLRKAG